MRRSAGLYGLLGMELLFFGAVEFYFAREFLPFWGVNLVGGVFFIIMWMVSGGSTLTETLGARSARYGANAAVYTIAFVAIVVAINYISTLHHGRLDLTSEKIYSLSSQSQNAVKQLKEPLKMIGFFQGGENEGARQLYAEYAYASPKVSFELVDPDKHPEIAQRYKVSQMGTTRIQIGGDEKGQGRNVTELSEEALTNAILNLRQSGKKVAEFLDGHGEADPNNTDNERGYGAVKTALEGEGYEVRKLNLASLEKVPDDATLVVVAGPTKPLVPGEIDRLNTYLKQGGRVLVTLQVPSPLQPIDESGLLGLLGQWGIKAGNDIVIDQQVRLFQGPTLGVEPFVEDYGDSPITHDFKQRTVFPFSRSLTLSEPAKPGLALVALAKTGATSFAESNLKDLYEHQQAKLTDKDPRGPITVAATSDANLTELGWGKGNARLVVFSSTDFANNKYIGDFFNRDLFVNSVDWLAGQENAVSIRPATMRSGRFLLTSAQFFIIFALSVLLLPQALLVAGTIVWSVRRN